MYVILVGASLVSAGCLCPNFENTWFDLTINEHERRVGQADKRIHNRSTVEAVLGHRERLESHFPKVLKIVSRVNQWHIKGGGTALVK